MDDRERAIRFGVNLRKLRKKQKLSTRELAKKTGVSQSYISHLETGRKNRVPSPDILTKLAGPLKVSYSELMLIAGYFTSEDINANYAGGIQVISTMFFLEMVDQKYKMKLPQEVKDNLEQFMLEKQINDVKLETFFHDLKKFAELLEEGFRTGESMMQVLDDNRNLMHVQNYFYNQFLKEPVDNQKTINEPIIYNNSSDPIYYELSEIFSPSSVVPVHWNNRLLSADDCQRILDMLKLLFPN